MSNTSERFYFPWQQSTMHSMVSYINALLWRFAEISPAALQAMLGFAVFSAVSFFLAVVKLILAPNKDTSAKAARRELIAAYSQQQIRRLSTQDPFAVSE